jgi:hypothetical protein
MAIVDCTHDRDVPRVALLVCVPVAEMVLSSTAKPLVPSVTFVPRCVKPAPAAEKSAVVALAHRVKPITISSLTVVAPVAALRGAVLVPVPLAKPASTATPVRFALE